MVVYLVLNVCETLLDSVRNYFKQDKRTNDEIKAKLFEMFEYNRKEFNKFARMYSGNRIEKIQSIYDVIDYEDSVIEKFKKRMCGDEI